MRILQILNHVRESGNGIVNSTVDLSCLLSRRHDVAVASETGAFLPLLAQYGVKHFEFVQRRTPVGLASAALRFRAIVSNFNPDIVHAQMMTGAVIARAIRLGSRYRTVTTVHNEWERSALVMCLGDIVTANSVAVASAMEKRGIPRSKLRIVKIGALGGPRRERMQVEPAALERPALLTVAGLYFRKGIDVLIEAFERIPQTSAHLYVVGDGPDREAFRLQARRSRVADRIHFVGFQSCPERYMLGADIFVLASRKEPFGMVISEAREAGCAIVASNVDGIPEALDQGTAGVLVPAGDAVALAAALEQLLDDPSALGRARARALEGLEYFRATRYSEEMEAVYRDALTRSH